MLSSKARRASGSGSQAGYAVPAAPVGVLVPRILGAAKLGRSGALLLLVALMVACESEPEWKRPAPNLSGVYDLVSFSLRDGPTYEAPEATGIFELSRDYGEDPGQATGDLSLDVIVTSLDPPLEVGYYGQYVNDNDGTWRQRGVAAEALGTYNLDFSAEVGDTTLTISITEPAAAVSTYVWRPR